MSFPQPFNSLPQILVRQDGPVLASIEAGFGPPHVVEARRELDFDGPCGRRAFLIVEGWAYTYKILQDGSRQVVEIAVAGDMLGLHGLLSGHRDLQAATAAPSIVRQMSAGSLAGLLRASPDAAVALCATAARSHELLTERLVDVARRTAVDRLGHLLLELKHRLARAGLGTRTSYRCPLTQQLLADALGLTGIHVNRTLRQLRDAGLVTMHDGVVEIHDEPRLARLVGYEPPTESDAVPSGAIAALQAATTQRWG